MEAGCGLLYRSRPWQRQPGDGGSVIVGPFMTERVPLASASLIVITECRVRENPAVLNRESVTLWISGLTVPVNGLVVVHVAVMVIVF